MRVRSKLQVSVILQSICIVLIFVAMAAAKVMDEQTQIVTDPLQVEDEVSQYTQPPPLQDYSYDLADLEKRIDESASIQAEIARLEEILAILQHERILAGWKIVGHVRGGYMDEQLTSDQRREYFPSQLSAGLTYPLFGKRQEEKSNLLELENSAVNEELRVSLKRIDAKETLRLSYILLWGAEQKIRLADAFLKKRNFFEDLLKKRVNTGYLLEADYLEFISTMDLAERERAIHHSTAERARDLIHALTGIHRTQPLTHPPRLPAVDGSMESAVAALSEYPEIVLYQNNVELELQRLKMLHGSDIKGNLTIRGLVGASEYVFSDYGYGGMVSIDFSLPLDPFSADRSDQAVKKLSLKRHQRLLQAKTEELELLVKDRFRSTETEQANLRFALTRMQAATELLREKTLRIGRIDGDVLEQLQKARFNYYRVAVDYIEAEIRLLNSSTRLLRFQHSSDGELVASHSAKTLIQPLDKSLSSYAVSIPEDNQDEYLGQEAGIAVYLWDSGPYINGIEPVELFKQRQIDTLLVSLNREQLEKLHTEAGRKEFQDFMQTCRIAGINPGILLGEPTWILPEYRNDLLEILSFLNFIDVERIHLDMEPYQLDVEKYGFTYLSAQLLRTLQMSTEISDHAIEISIHPRLLSEEVVGFCLGCGLANLELKRVVVMIYTTDLKHVQKQMQTFAEKYPAINLAVAQSVESILGPKNSYAHYGMESFQKNLRTLLTGDEESAWFGDVYIQDWSSYLQLPYGDQKKQAVETRQ